MPYVDLQVLGTFITEWGLGARRCSRLFKDAAAAQAVADQLLAIAKHYGFEGWLINIENGISEHGVQMMLHFLGYLRARLHAEIPHGTAIW
jgi:mannosyl-glycoprotein endo-beta-N-acetylglucosaminidase